MKTFRVSLPLPGGLALSGPSGVFCALPGTLQTQEGPASGHRSTHLSTALLMALAAAFSFAIGTGVGLAQLPLRSSVAAIKPLPSLPSSGVIQTWGAGAADPVGPGDLLDVEVLGQPQLSGTARVGADGSLDLPFLGAVAAAGETPAQLEQQLTPLYGRMLRSPRVSVRVLENNSRTISVTGAVPRPGVYAYSGQLTLRQALALAGGLDPARDGASLYVLHASPVQVTPGKPAHLRVQTVLRTIATNDLLRNPRLDLALAPGDSVEVPPTDEIYISGAINHAGSMPLSPGLTLAQAFSRAGGGLPQSDIHHVRVLRRSGDQRRILLCDLSRIRENRAPDLPLQADDIVLVPSSKSKEVGLTVLDFIGAATRWRIEGAAFTHF